MDERLLRAVGLGLVVAVLVALVLWILPTDRAATRSGPAPTPEAIVLEPVTTPQVAQSAAAIDAATLWGAPKAAATAPKPVGRIVAAVRTREEKYLLVQFDQQQPVQLKVGDVLPEGAGPYAGGRIDDIQSERVILSRDGKRIIMTVLN